MTNQEFQCHQCGEIFIVRSEDNARSHNYCPICRKKYYEQKMLEEKKAPAVPEWMKKILLEKEPKVDDRVFYSSGC